MCVNAKLIDARTDSQIWAESYDRDVADLFVIQSDLAQAIVNQLQAKLSPQQKAEIEETPTRDLAAFDLYLQAKEIVDTYLELQDPGSSLLKAVRLLDEATERDPNFVLAYCYASRAHNLLYFLDLDPTPKRNLLGEAAVNNALRLRPNSAEAHLAKADHYFRCHRDYERAGRTGDSASGLTEQRAVLQPLRLHQSTTRSLDRSGTRFRYRGKAGPA